MAILVTGGLVYRQPLRGRPDRAGADVVVVDDLSKGHREALKGGRLYVGSVADRAFLDDVFSREPIEAVIHFAAFSLVGESMQVPEQYFRNNVTAGLTLIETMLAHKVPYLVFSSTAATFGEPEYVPIDEAHPQNPTNPYGESKLIVEKMLKWCDLAHGLKFCALRYFNVAGAWHDGSIGEDHRPESHLIPLILQVAQGKREQLSLFGTDYHTKDGTCIRDYIHVEGSHRRPLPGPRLPEAHQHLRRLQPGQRTGLLQPGDHRGRPPGHRPPHPRPGGGPPPRRSRHTDRLQPEGHGGAGLAAQVHQCGGHHRLRLEVAFLPPRRLRRLTLNRRRTQLRRRFVYPEGHWLGQWPSGYKAPSRPGRRLLVISFGRRAAGPEQRPPRQGAPSPGLRPPGAGHPESPEAPSDPLGQRVR